MKFGAEAKPYRLDRFRTSPATGSAPTKSSAEAGSGAAVGVNVSFCVILTLSRSVPKTSPDGSLLVNTIAFDVAELTVKLTDTRMLLFLQISYAP